MHIPIKTLIPNGKQSLKLFDTSLQPSIPIPLRIGDFNLDGFPDILGVIYNETSQDSQAVLFENIPNNKSERTLSYLNNYSKFQSLNSINEVRMASFIDLDEDGTLDIMIQRQPKNEDDKNYVIFIQNNIVNDAFFIKTLRKFNSYKKLTIKFNRTSSS